MLVIKLGDTVLDSREVDIEVPTQITAIKNVELQVEFKTRVVEVAEVGIVAGISD